MARRKKVPSSSERAQRIIDAIKELHESCYDAWNHDDHLAFGAAFAVAKDMERIVAKEGETIEGWNGGNLYQLDAIGAGISVLLAYEADTV